MLGCAYSCLTITINGARLLEPYPLLAPAPNADLVRVVGRAASRLLGYRTARSVRSHYGFMRSRDGVVLGVHGRISGCSLGEEGAGHRADDERPCCWSGIPRRRTYSSYSSEL